MKKLQLILLMGVIAFAAIAQEENSTDQEIIIVTGVAEMEIAPNRIYLEINIQEKDLKGRKTLEDLENEMIQKLQSLNIDVNKKLAVKDVASNFKFHFLGAPSIKTSKSYQLELSEPQQVPQVILALEEIGISNINLEKLDHTDIENYKKDVRIKAVVDAKDKATYLLNAVDQKLGKLIYVEEVNNDTSTLQGRAAGLQLRGVSMYGSSSKQYQTIEFEKIKLVYNILAKFRIE